MQQIPNHLEPAAWKIIVPRILCPILAVNNSFSCNERGWDNNSWLCKWNGGWIYKTPVAPPAKRTVFTTNYLFHMLFACRSNGHMFHQLCFCRIEILYLYIVFILQKIHGCGRLTKKGRWFYSTVPSPSRIVFVCASVSVFIISCISRQATQGWEFKIAAHMNGWYFTSEILQRHLRKFVDFWFTFSYQNVIRMWLGHWGVLEEQSMRSLYMVSQNWIFQKSILVRCFIFSLKKLP